MSIASELTSPIDPMPKLQRRRVVESKEIRRFPNGEIHIVTMDDFTFGEFRLRPGWRWSTDVKPIVGTQSCLHHHAGYVLEGQMHIEMTDGNSLDIFAGDAYEIPPGHDAWIVGETTYRGIEFSGVRSYALPQDNEGTGIVATILFTDIVNSTAILTQVGDRQWREMLLGHNAAMRIQLDRYRGQELKTTGDGFLAAFDSASRAIFCAQGMVQASRENGLAIRAGCHTGEVVIAQGDAIGMAVHAAARVMSLAGAGEIYLSSTTRDLIHGSGISLHCAGHHTLKGFEGQREIFRVADQ